MGRVRCLGYSELIRQEESLLQIAQRIKAPDNEPGVLNVVRLLRNYAERSAR